MNPRLLIVSLLALAAHTSASANSVVLGRPATFMSRSEADEPQATVRSADLDLRHDSGADILRRRVDRTVVALSGGDNERNRPEVIAARARARAQADAAIAAARA